MAHSLALNNEIVYDGTGDCLWPSQPTTTELFSENWEVNIHLCMQLSATRACKEVWCCQGLVFSSELSVIKSVSDCQLFIYKTFLFCFSVEVQIYWVSITLWVKSIFITVTFGYQCRAVILSTSIIIIFHHSYQVLLTGDSVTLSINIIYSI
jgi:hypothetical protein